MTCPERFPLPMAYGDPAFLACLSDAIEIPELVENFDRLYGTSLLKGKPNKTDMEAFTAFVHDSVYLRLPNDAIHSLRAAALAQGA